MRHMSSVQLRKHTDTIVARPVIENAAEELAVGNDGIASKGNMHRETLTIRNPWLEFCLSASDCALEILHHPIQ